MDALLHQLNLNMGVLQASRTLYTTQFQWGAINRKTLNGHLARIHKGMNAIEHARNLAAEALLERNAGNSQNRTH
jgi:hypothetical protein